MARYAEIALTKGLKAKVSVEDAHLASRSWQAFSHRNGTHYALGKVSLGGKKQKTISLHRVIVGMIPNGHHVGHINGDPLDNRRENLRVVGRDVNNRNRVSGQKNSKTGILGVSPKGEKFVAMIKANSSQKYLGTFETVEEAQKARLKAEKTLWGIEPRRAALFGES